MTKLLPPKPSNAAVIGFIVTALSLSCATLGCQYAAWFVEQIGLASASLGAARHAGKIWLAAQAVIVIITAGTFFAFSRNTLRPIYQGWLMAGVFSLPAVGLRFLGPNQDQLGAILQIVLALAGGAVAFAIRRREIVWAPRGAAAAIAVAPFIAIPFFLWGAAGSGADILLQLLAGLAFGLPAALLVAASADNFLLNSLGAGTLLVLLGSAYGYDGGQLLLMFVMLPVGLIVAALAPSAAGAAAAIGLTAAIPLIFFDPTELTILLGDIFNWALAAAALSLVPSILAGIGLGLYGKWQSRPKTILLPLGAAGAGWAAALVIFLVFGQPGFYGDRLFVILKDQADVSRAYAIPDRTERLTFVYNTLVSHANTTQAGLRSTFDSAGMKYQPYYLVNAIEVQGGTLTRLWLATRPEVDRVIPSPVLRPLPQPPAESSAQDTQVHDNPGWNISMIGADRVWDEFGATGEGIVVGNSDTGVQGDHPALAASYRGLTQGDDYNWFDPWEGSASPNDQQGHGTHTMGTVLGSGGIGVAPGAQWIACVNLERNLGNPAVYLDCLQFMLAPFPQHGDPLKDGDPARAAHVLNNSWGCPPIEGCDPTSLQPAIEALRAAGIFVVVSAGNDGPMCGTVNAPPALYDAAFSVGAVNSSGDLAEFSSRGPVTADGSGRLKPDIAAPGVEVYSAWPGSTYLATSGTSMAGPHVAGAVALLWSARPALIGDIDRTEQILRDTAQPYTGVVSSAGGCDDLPLPNNGVGAGIVNAYEAVKLALGR